MFFEKSKKKAFWSVIQYNTVKSKTFKPNLFDKLKDISAGIFLFFIFAFFKTETISELK